VKLNELRPNPGSRRAEKRRGRGTGSGTGGTSGRGHKGQKARTSGTVRPGFEGGQMPLQRRLPKRGFWSRGRVVNQIVNLSALADLPAGSVVDFESLRAQGLIRRLDQPVKILAGGEVTVALTVKGPAVSAAALEKIEAAGGTVQTAGVKKKARSTGRPQPPKTKGKASQEESEEEGESS
jgi:large subunit ribosomal protein L15